MYLITSRTEIAGFGAGSTNYYIGCRLTLDPISGDPDDVIGYLQGGPDDMPLAAHNLQVMELFRGDTIKHEITAVHASQGGTVSTVNRLAIIKIDEV
jgi:hypothetical protein